MASRPERAFRIADSRHSIFDGAGAFLHGGRWNSPGTRVIYASETYPGALLEILAHTRIGRVPRTQAWIEISIPAGVSVEEVRADDVDGWDEPESARARAYGDAWVRERRSAVLVVPSVAASGLARNILIHQDHREFRLLKASEPRPVTWDSRLMAAR